MDLGARWPRRMMLGLLVLWVCARAESGGFCDQPDCTSCLAQTVEQDGTNEPQCKWCYALQRCMDKAEGGGDMAFCPAYTTSPEVCDCEPGKASGCDDCVEKRGCVWIDKGSQNRTSKIQRAFAITSARAWDGLCWSGNMMGPTHTVDTVSNGDLTLQTSRQAEAWFWGQCALQNRSLGSMIVLAVVIVVACAGVFFCTSSRAAREGSGQEQY
mmetsp:Transcript_20277/g.59797  ORF Transcript_20277/g.59797 Transcript_20277/m.59797 type:complete len:213 (-) Transcript_20277:206-844(-)